MKYIKTYQILNRLSIIEYAPSKNVKKTIILENKSFNGVKGVIGIIGSGNFTSSMILQAKKCKANIKYS